MSPKAKAILSAAVPFAATLAFVLAFAVDFPWHDDWYDIPSVEHAYEGSLSLQDFWQLHNEHVVVFPRAVIFSVALLTGLNLKIQLLTSFAFMTAAAALTGWMLFRALAPWWAVPIAAAFLFSLHAWENWLWANQVHVALAVLGAVGALALLGADSLRGRSLAGAAALAFVASWSFLSGFLVWPAGALVLALRPFASRAARLRALGVWTAVALVAVALPFWTYGIQLPSAARAASAGTLLEFTARYLGTGLLGSEAADPPIRAVGWAGLAAFGAGAAWIASARRRDPAVLSLVALALVGVLTGPMIGIGRLRYGGFVSARGVRYVPFSSLAWIFILVFPALAVARRGRVLRVLSGALAGAGLAVLVVTELPEIEVGRTTSAARKDLAGALRRGEGLSWERLRAIGAPEALLPTLGARLATLRRWKLSFFRDAGSEELNPPSFTGRLSATVAFGETDGRITGTAHVSGGVPGNVALAVIGREGIPIIAGFTNLGPDGNGTLAFDLGPPPPPAPEMLVVSLDREGRLVPAPPFAIR